MLFSYMCSATAGGFTMSNTIMAALRAANWTPQRIKVTTPLKIGLFPRTQTQ